METAVLTIAGEIAAPAAPAAIGADGVPVLAWAPTRIEMWDVDRLRPDPRNARKHSARQIENIRASIRRHGFPRPIFAREDGRIIAGEGRWQASKLEGYAKVPVITAPPQWSDDQCREYALADNALGLASEWDDDLLRVEGAELLAKGVRLEELGFEPAQLEDLGLIAKPSGNGPGPQAQKVRSAAAQLGDLAYQVVITCKDETDQRDVLGRLTGEGFKCRALIS